MKTNQVSGFSGYFHIYLFFREYRLLRNGKGVDVYKLFYYTISEIKAQQAKIEELEALKELVCLDLPRTDICR